VTREDVALRAPDPSRDYKDMPSVSTMPRAKVYRAHHRDFGTWYFASHTTGEVGGGRFDLTFDDGTCYLADSTEVAVWERLGPTYLDAQVVPASVADEFVVTAVYMPVGDCANTAHPHARKIAGITREISTVGNYALTQAWAEAFKRSGFAGIRYGARFTPEEQSNAWALFGKAGEESEWKTEEQIAGRDACAEAGLGVIEVPWTVMTVEPGDG
jgi:hypothetical protein